MNKGTFFDYCKNFRNGLNETRYASEEELLKCIEVDYSNIESIGYYDGFEYGKYCVMAGMRYDVKEEHIIAVIYKGYNHAIEEMEEYEKKGKKEKKK